MPWALFAIIEHIRAPNSEPWGTQEGTPWGYPIDSQTLIYFSTVKPLTLHRERDLEAHPLYSETLRQE